MVSNVDTLNGLSKRWNGPCFWSPAIGWRGVLIFWVPLDSVTMLLCGRRMPGASGQSFDHV